MQFTAIPGTPEDIGSAVDAGGKVAGLIPPKSLAVTMVMGSLVHQAGYRFRTLNHKKSIYPDPSSLTNCFFI